VKPEQIVTNKLIFRY